MFFFAPKRPGARPGAWTQRPPFGPSATEGRPGAAKPLPNSNWTSLANYRIHDSAVGWGRCWPKTGSNRAQNTANKNHLSCFS